MRLSVPVDVPAGWTLSGLFAARRPMLRRWLEACRGPDAGEKPHGLRIPDRGWRRNSALIMSLHGQDGY